MPNTDDDLNEEEREDCERERFMYLNKRIEEERIFAEEEKKRAQEITNTYAAIGFDYEGKNKAEQSDTTVTETFKLPWSLAALSDIPYPDTQQQLDVIAKTAQFISSQDEQMQEFIRIKQSANPLFGFLSPENPLHEFYNRVLAMIRDGSYVYKPSQEDVKESTQAEAATAASGTETTTITTTDKQAMGIVKLQKTVNLLGAAYADSDEEEEEGEENDEKRRPSSAEINTTPEIKADVKTKPEAKAKPETKKIAETSVVVTTNAAALVSHGYNESFRSDEEDDTEIKRKPSKGVMIPPPDIRLAAEKIAAFVAKGRWDIERKVVIDKAADARFSFLSPWDQYYPFYQDALRIEREAVTRQNSKETAKAAKIEHEWVEWMTRATKELEESTFGPTPVRFSLRKNEVSAAASVFTRDTAVGNATTTTTTTTATTTTTTRKRPKFANIIDPKVLDALKSSRADSSSKPSKSIVKQAPTPQAPPSTNGKVEDDAEAKLKQERKRKAAEFLAKAKAAKEREAGSSKPATATPTAAPALPPTTTTTTTATTPASSHANSPRAPSPIAGIGAPSVESLRTVEDLMATLRAAQKRR